MKNFILSSLLIISNISLLWSQWILQNSNTTNALTDVSFVNDSVGYASASDSRIVKTTNGGNLWTEINTGLSMSFHAVQAISADTVFISRQPLYKSVNGGSSFTNVAFSMIGSSIFEIEFADSRTGLLSKGSDVYKTTDAGDSWAYKTKMQGLNPDFQFLSYPIAFAGGGYNSYGQMYKTTDWGETWHSLNLTTSDIHSFYFLDTCLGYFINFESEFYKTTNGGQSFSLVSISMHDTFITDLVFIDEYIGYAISTGTIHKTVNGGINWTVDYALPQPVALAGITKTEHNILYVIGNDGVILKNTTHLGTSPGTPCGTSVNTFTGISELQYNNGWILYPNPIFQSGTLIFDNSKNTDYILTLFNCQGQSVRRITGTAGGRIEIDKANLPQGLYFFQLQSNAQIIASGRLAIE